MKLNERELEIDHGIDFQIEQMIEKKDDLWRCKVCGKIASQKSTIQNHSETHIEGVQHDCHVCNKIFSTRCGLRTHISGIHSAVVSCDVCGKTGMNKKSYREHRRSHHIK